MEPGKLAPEADLTPPILLITLRHFFLKPEMIILVFFFELLPILFIELLDNEAYLEIVDIFLVSSRYGDAESLELIIEVPINEVSMVPLESGLHNRLLHFASKSKNPKGESLELFICT